MTGQAAARGADDDGYAGAPPETEAAELLNAALAGARYIGMREADRATLTWENKAHADFVSDVDRGAEERVRDVLLAQGDARDEAQVIGEELSPGGVPRAGTVYIVDPLDGTTNFLHGYPWYAVSIARLVDGELDAGVVHNVATGDVFLAVRGRGAWRGNQRVRVSPITETERALVGTGFPFKAHERLPEFARQFSAVTRATAGIRRAGSAALDLCDVACGRFEAFWELTLAPWDYAAGTLLVREAGGVVTDLDGAAPTFGHTAIVAGSPHMHAWLIETLTANS